MQLGEGCDTPKPKRVSLPSGIDWARSSLDFALRLLSLPRTVGVDPESGKTVSAGLAASARTSSAAVATDVKSLDQVFTISLADALKALEPTGASVLKELGASPAGGAELRVMAGRYGPYVTDGTLLASLPKDADPEAFTAEQAVALLAEKGKPRGSGKGRRRGTTRPATAGGRKATGAGKGAGGRKNEDRLRPAHYKPASASRSKASTVSRMRSASRNSSLSATARSSTPPTRTKRWCPSTPRAGQRPSCLLQLAGSVAGGAPRQKRWNHMARGAVSLGSAARSRSMLTKSPAGRSS